MMKMSRTSKDALFCDLFSQPEYLFELYRVLHPEDTETTMADLEIVSLDRVLTDGEYNDLGFTVGSRLLVLVEAQSTWSLNIVTRMLLYTSETYRRLLEKEGKGLHRTGVLKMLVPELYVIFTGWRDVPDKVSFTHDVLDGATGSIEVTARVLRGGGDDVIGQYVRATRVIDEVRSMPILSEEKARLAVETCIERGILVSYFEDRRTEVTDAMFTLYDQERETRLYHEELKQRYKEEFGEQGRIEGMEQGLAEGRAEGRMKGRAEGLAEGRAEGRAEGLEQGRITAYAEATHNLMKAQDLAPESAMDVLGVPVDERPSIIALL